MSTSTSSTWDFQSYIESKMNRLSNKLSIRRIDPRKPIGLSHYHNKLKGNHTLDCRTLLRKWFRMAVSNYFYPTFLNYFQMSA
ncbi:hypothetical protein J2X61_004487 [Bacillus sp. 3255]|nr:hypothetical protein [Bacillus sp. 3255]